MRPCRQRTNGVRVGSLEDYFPDSPIRHAAVDNAGRDHILEYVDIIDSGAQTRDELPNGRRDSSGHRRVVRYLRTSAGPLHCVCYVSRCRLKRWIFCMLSAPVNESTALQS